MRFWRRAGWNSARLDQFTVDRGASTPVESAAIEVDRLAVELDGPVDRLCRQRHQPPLISKAEHEEVRRQRIAEQTGRQPRRVEEFDAALTDRGRHRLRQFAL